jgi:hypothetical protein
LIKLRRLFSAPTNQELIKEILKVEKFEWLIGNYLYEAILNG